MASTEIRDWRRTLRYRHLLVRQMVQMKNRFSGLLMETGVSHNQQRLHKVGYFRELLSSHEEVRDSIRPLLRLSRETIVRCQKTNTTLAGYLPFSETVTVSRRYPRSIEAVESCETLGHNTGTSKERKRVKRSRSVLNTDSRNRTSKSARTGSKGCRARSRSTRNRSRQRRSRVRRPA